MTSPIPMIIPTFCRVKSWIVPYPPHAHANRWADPSAKKEGKMDFEKIVRETVAEWSYSGRMGSAKGLELLVSDLTARLESAQQGFAADETNRLRELLWVNCLCGACGC